MLSLTKKVAAKMNPSCRGVEIMRIHLKESSVRLELTELRTPPFLRAAIIAAFGALGGCSTRNLPNHVGWNDTSEAMIPVQLRRREAFRTVLTKLFSTFSI